MSCRKNEIIQTSRVIIISILKRILSMNENYYRK